MFLQLDNHAKEALKAMQGEVRAVKEAISSQARPPALIQDCTHHTPTLQHCVCDWGI